MWLWRLIWLLGSRGGSEAADALYSEEKVLQHARLRVAQLFNVQPDRLASNAVFGEDLEATVASDFKANEFDQLDHDIRDVADRQIRKELASGALVIRTVGDYCDHMVRCYRTNPKEVIRALRIGEM